MSRNLKTSAFILALVNVSMIAFADDTVPPPWQRFQPNTTTQEWTFPDGNLPHAADNNSIYWNPNGIPHQIDTRNLGGGIEWLPVLDGREGIYQVNPGGIMVFEVPNDPTLREEKQIWAQITWKVDPGANTVDLVPFGGSVPPVTVEDGTDMGDGWKHSTFSYVLRPNPALEFYQIRNLSTGSALYIDQVVIDTQCVPEPVSLAALAGGVLALTRRRRR